MKYTIHCDGLCHPNPGKGTWAFVVFDQEGNVVHQDKGFGGNKQTNQTMEYRAVIEAMVWCHELEDPVLILTDSALVVNQLNGVWKVKSQSLRGWYDNAYDLLEPHMTIGWIKGTDNKADEPTRQAYADETGIYPTTEMTNWSRGKKFT